MLGEVGPTQVDKQWTIHIYPPMALRNLLPFPVKVLEPVSFSIDGGNEVPINVVPGHTMIFTMEYGESYTARFDILEERTELDSITFVADKDPNKKLVCFKLFFLKPFLFTASGSSLVNTKSQT